MQPQNQGIDTTLDEITSLILLSLDANHKDDVVYAKKCVGGAVMDLVDQGSLLKIGKMFPSSAFTIDQSNGREERLLAIDLDYLCDHPVDILGEENEVILLDDDHICWYGLQKLKHAPRGVVPYSRPSAWYALHYRQTYLAGHGTYYRRVVPIDAKGKVIPAKIQGHWVCHPNTEGITFMLACSIIEDALRANTILASVKDATEIKFPVPLGEHKDLFALRDAPLTPTGRRKAILHWVSKHIRASSKGKLHRVKKFTRGAREIEIEGITIKLTPNARHQ